MKAVNVKRVGRIAIMSVFALLPFVAMRAQQLPLGWNIKAEFNNSASQRYTMKHPDGGNWTSGNCGEDFRARINAGYSFKVARPLTLGVSARYEYVDEHVSNIPSHQIAWRDKHNTFRANFNAMFQSRLWGKPLIGLVYASTDFSRWGAERVSGIGAALLMLKTTRETQFGVGGLLLVNTTSSIPFIPIASYRHVFSPKWTLNLNYPFYSMQYSFSPQHILGAGFTVDTYGFWLRPDDKEMPRTVFYRRSLLKTGLNYDWHITPQISLVAQGGWEYTMNGGLYTASGRHHLYEFGKHPSGAYMHLGVSIRPGKKPAATPTNPAKKY